MKLARLAVLLALPAILASRGFARVVSIVITGTVASGTDVSGVFGKPGTQLAGTFILVLAFDDTKGTRQPPECSPSYPQRICYSNISGSHEQSPGVATLQIGDSAPFKFGVPVWHVLSSVTRVIYPESSYEIGVMVGDSYALVNGTVKSSVVTPSQKAITQVPPITNAGWDSTFFDDQVNGAAEITFSISTPAAQASGLLAAHTIRIEATAPSTPKIEFDASKVNLQNIPSTKLARSATKSLPIVCLTDSAKIDLSVYLTPDSDVANAKWFVNGFPLPDSFITADFCPDLALVKTFDIVAQDAKTPSIKDELVVVFVSQLTKEAFDEWLKSESADVAWLKELPVPYDSLSANETDPEPAGCTPKLWESSHSINKYFHPGAVYEMRSQATPGGHGHQVTYDQLGHIIKQSALGAGSADKSHPPSFAHRSDDVLPFVWASQLDGNPVECWLGCLDLDAPLMHWGVHMDQYFTVRPVWANRTQVAGHCAP